MYISNENDFKKYYTKHLGGNSMDLHNYEISGIFGFNVVINETYAYPKFAEIGETVLPTAFMPPLYFFYLYLLKLLNINALNYLVKIYF